LTSWGIDFVWFFDFCFCCGLKSYQMYFPTSNGVEKRIESWKLIVPLYDNKRKRFRGELIENIRGKIINEFGGVSSISTVGAWKSGDQVFYDKATTIIVDIPVKNHATASAFFTDLKENLRTELRQEKIYITYEREASELLSANEFLQELGFETPPDQPQALTQAEINKLVEKSASLKYREGYRTLRLERDFELGIVLWERSVLGIRILTKIKDSFPKNAVILAADNLEDYFKEDTFGKPLIILGDYEYQSFILDKEKRRYVIGEPASFSKYDKGDKEPLYGPHAWHGMCRTSEFIPIYTEQLLISYIILRELDIQKERITMVVGSDGARQSVGSFLLLCPAVIPDKEVQKAILDNFIKAKSLYENDTIDKVALMQAKVLNRYNEKKAMIMGSRNLMEQ